jgi:hypothetical protein
MQRWGDSKRSSTRLGEKPAVNNQHPAEDTLIDSH